MTASTPEIKHATHDVELNDRGEPLCPTCHKAMVSEMKTVWFCPDMQCSFDEDIRVELEGDDSPVH